MNNTDSDNKSLAIQFPPKEELDIGDDGYYLPPEGIIVMKNGGGRVLEPTPKIVYGPGTFGPDPARFDAERIKEIHRIRKHRKEQAVVAQVEGRTGKSFPDAFADAAGAIWEQVVLDRGPRDHGGRERVEAAEWVRKQAGWGDDEKPLTTAEGGLELAAHITPALAREVRKIMELAMGTSPPAVSPPAAPVVDSHFSQGTSPTNERTETDAEN